MTQTLGELIETHKGKRSYRALAEASNGLIKTASFQGVATKPANTFPSTDTLRGVALALDRPITEVVLAAAASLGLDVEPIPDVCDLNERIFYHQHHAATYKAQHLALRARIIPRTP